MENREREAVVLIQNTLDDIRLALLAETLRVEEARLTLLSYSREEERPEESIRSNHLLLFNLRETLGILMLLANEGISDCKYYHQIFTKLKNSRLHYSISHLLDDQSAVIGQDSDKTELTAKTKMQLDGIYSITEYLLYKQKRTQSNLPTDFVFSCLPPN